jgi:hypothetical protein
LAKETTAKKQHSAYRLCESLGYEDGIIYGDIERVIYNGLSTGDKDRNRVVYLLEQAEEVREWLQPGQSQVLIINGMGEACDAISSTSVFCAMMSHGIGNADDVMVLRWFCGLHITDEGVPAMLRNLIGQVLMHVNTAVDLSKHKTIWFKKYWNCEDPRMLLDLLEDFIREQLEKTPVLILLDGASFLENKTYFRDMYCTVQRLSSLVDGKDGCEFKLLLTSPIRVMELLSRSDPAIVLNVPHWVDGVTFAANQNDLLEIAQSQARGLGDAFDDLEIR